MGRTSHEGLAVAGALCLGGMASCHCADVGMKFEEHVYYMGALFIANIVASVMLIPAILLAEWRFTTARQAAWATATALAVLTIAGFLYSRTVGFPQMEDHVGEWDALGLTSLGFEVLLVGLGAGRLRELQHDAGRSAPIAGVPA